MLVYQSIVIDWDHVPRVIILPSGGSPHLHGNVGCGSSQQTERKFGKRGWKKRHNGEKLKHLERIYGMLQKRNDGGRGGEETRM